MGGWREKKGAKKKRRCQSGTLHCSRTIGAQDRSVSRAISQSALIIPPPPPSLTPRTPPPPPPFRVQSSSRWHMGQGRLVCVLVCVCVVLSIPATITIIAQAHTQPPTFMVKKKEKRKTNKNQTIKGFSLSLNKLNADFCFFCVGSLCELWNRVLYVPVSLVLRAAVLGDSHTHTHTYIRTHTHTHTYLYIHAHKNSRHAHVFARIRLCMCVRVHVFDASIKY